MKTKSLFLVIAALLPLLLSCNVYSPVAATGSEEQILEAALKCLHDNDVGCAITNYEKLATGQKKNEKLCAAYLSKAGFGLQALIRTLQQKNVNVLGDLANNLIPWTADKSDAADNAKTSCTAYATLATSAQQNLAALLKTTSLFLHCATRIAKTDLYLGSSDSDTTCTTPGGANGTIGSSDIFQSSDGTISTAQPGMCKADADMCLTDIMQIDTTGLTNAGLGDIRSGYDALPVGLRTSGTATAAIRTAITSTLR